MNRKKRIACLAGVTLFAGIFTGCAMGGRRIPEPITIMVWNCYSGEQQETFNALVESFNETVGKKKGIIVKTASQGSVNDLETNVMEAAEEKVGADDMPNIFSAYADTAYKNEELVTYYFQPLFSARTGKVKAYEALMRVNLPLLNNPEMVMRIAREEGTLYEIERMTMFKAVGSFIELRNRGIVDKDALLFVNSIANQHMSLEDEMEFNACFGKFLKQIVLEITEEEALDYDALKHKKIASGFGGAFALDDYGSGYNNEKNLLELAPKYIKVDISIIRDIDTDPDKQQLVENIVTYAHQRDMKIVAEGLETPEELRKVLELGVDLLQGFYLAKPEAVPGKISEEALEVIIRGRRLWLFRATTSVPNFNIVQQFRKAGVRYLPSQGMGR